MVWAEAPPARSQTIPTKDASRCSTRTASFQLPGGASEQLDQFSRLLALLLGIATDDRAFDAMMKVALEHFGLDPRERRPNGLQLRQDVDAVAVLFDHARNAAHLAFDSAQAIEQSAFHAGLPGHTPMGYLPLDG